MSDLPVMLAVRGARCVVVGGGAVAGRRVGSLLEAGARVVVVAPEVSTPLSDLAAAREHRADGEDDHGTLTIARRAVKEADVDGAMLVIAATDDPGVNAQVADWCARRGVLVNRVDAPTHGNVVIPAHARHGPVTLAVSVAGISAQAATTIRRELSASLDPVWPGLLEAARPYRALIQARFTGRRRADLLAALCDATARAVFKASGPDGFKAHLDGMIHGDDEADSQPPPSKAGLTE